MEKDFNADRVRELLERTSHGHLAGSLIVKPVRGKPYNFTVRSTADPKVRFRATVADGGLFLWLPGWGTFSAMPLNA